MKIFILTHSDIMDKVGGAISVFFSMCDTFIQAGHIVICACEAEGNRRPKPLNDNARFYCIQEDYSKSVNEIVACENPDIIIFYFIDFYINAKLGPSFDNIPRILMFHSRPDVYLSRSFTRELRKVYKNTTSQVLFDSYRQLLPTYIRNGSVVTIPNAVSIPSKVTNLSVEHKKIIYFSRIDQWKGCEQLINSFALIAGKYPEWTVDVYGQCQNPDYHKKLIKQIELYGIQKQFHLCGLSENKETVFFDYDFCVFPSFFEGFSVGLAETLSYGLPCIGFKCSSGINEIIVDGANGILCDFTNESLSEAMERLILDKELRIRMGFQARISVEPYAKSTIENMWLDLIRNVAHKTENNLLPFKSIKRLGENNIKFCSQYNVKKFKQLYKNHPGLYWTGICLRDDFIFSISMLINRLRHVLHLKHIDYQNIPIIIYNDNNFDSLRNIISALEDRGYRNIYVIDDSSTSQAVLDYYQTLNHKVFFPKEGKGYSLLWNTPQIFSIFKDSYYVYTNSIFEIKDSFPKNFVSSLFNTIKKYPTCDRVGIKSDFKINDAGSRDLISNNIFRSFVSDEFAIYAPFADGIKGYGHFSLEIADNFLP